MDTFSFTHDGVFYIALGLALFLAGLAVDIYGVKGKTLIQWRILRCALIAAVLWNFAVLWLFH